MRQILSQQFLGSTDPDAWDETEVVRDAFDDGRSFRIHLARSRVLGITPQEALALAGTHAGGKRAPFPPI